MPTRCQRLGRGAITASSTGSACLTSNALLPSKEILPWVQQGKRSPQAWRPAPETMRRRSFAICRRSSVPSSRRLQSWANPRSGRQTEHATVRHASRPPANSRNMPDTKPRQPSLTSKPSPGKIRVMPSVVHSVSAWRWGCCCTSIDVRCLGGRSSHSRPKLDHIAIHDELAVAVMVDGFWIALPWVGPGLQHLENKQIVLVHQTAIDHSAFEIGKAFGDQRRSHALRSEERRVGKECRS